MSTMSSDDAFDSDVIRVVVALLESEAHAQGCRISTLFARAGVEEVLEEGGYIKQARKIVAAIYKELK